MKRKHKPGIINRIAIYVIGLFLASSFCTACAANKKEYHPYPSYYEVVTKYIGDNRPNSEDKLQALHFEKKREGWVVCQIEYYVDHDKTQVKYRNRRLIWSSDSLKYTYTDKLYIKPSLEAEQYLSTHSRDWYEYERIPYYGYDKWEEDVIADFADYETTNDTLTEGLARAYSGYANSFLWNQYGNDASGDSLRQKLSPLEQPSDERIKQFIQNTDKSQALFKTILARNPEYKTIVGDIATKCFYDELYAYMILNACNKPVEASKYLDHSQPPQRCIDAAKNYLNSVAPNGILFTYGDGDTFPLTYVQKKQGYRTDVSVINLSLLGAAWYVRQIAKTAKLSISDTTYGHQDFAYAIQRPIAGNESIPMSISDVIKVISKTIGGNPAWYPYREAYYVESENTRIPITIGRSLLLGDIMMFDIIQSNMKERPIYLVYNTNFIDRSNLKQQGIVYRFGAAGAITDKDAAQQKEYLTKTFISSIDMTGIELQPYMTAVYELCTYYADNGKEAEAKSLMLGSFEMLKAANFNTNYIYSLYYTISLMYKLGLTEEAKRLENRVLEIAERDTLFPESLHYMNANATIHFLEQLRATKAEYNASTANVDMLIRKIESSNIAKR